MKKSILTIASLLVLGLGLTGCGGTSSVVSSTAPSSVTPSSVTPSSVSSVPTLTLTTFAISNKSAFAGEIHAYDDPIALTFDIDDNVNLTTLIQDGDLTVTSSDTKIVNPIGIQLAPMAKGTATITVKCGGKTDTLDITVLDAIPVAYKNVKIDDFIAIAEKFGTDSNKGSVTDNKTVYEIHGGIAGDLKNDAYGNGYLYNADGSKRVQVYGTAIGEGKGFTTRTNAAGDVELAVTFSNPKNFLDKDGNPAFANGDHVVYTAILLTYKGIPEISGWVDTSMVGKSVNFKNYKATIAGTGTDGAFEHGIAALAAAEGESLDQVYIGQEIGVTVTPDSGYKASVTLNGNGVAADKDGKFSFTAGFKNEVVVTFISASSVKTSMTLDVDSLALPSGYADGSAVVDSVSYTIVQVGNYGNGIQMRYKNSIASKFFNTSALPYGIKSVVLTFNPTQSATAALTDIKVGSAAQGSGETKTISYDETNHEYTFTPNSSDFTYLTVEHTKVSGAVYLDSVVINYNIA